MNIDNTGLKSAIYIPPDFKEFPKIPRLSREIVITEKINGTNASICIDEITGDVLIGSRTRWITPQNDNFGFAKWVQENLEELKHLGPGHHFGEWWGKGIQCGYGLNEKRFSLFNTSRWISNNPLETNYRLEKPNCCRVVPVLYRGPFDTNSINIILEELQEKGSEAAPGWTKPEGIVIFHVAGNLYFKKTIEKDDEYKGKIR